MFNMIAAIQKALPIASLFFKDVKKGDYDITALSVQYSRAIGR